MGDFEIKLEFAGSGDSKMPTAREQIACFLESAAGILRRHSDGARDDSAAWRVADAALMLRCVMEDPMAWGKVKGVAGLDLPTGIGAMLPARPVVK